jgi:hypothetical protein
MARFAITPSTLVFVHSSFRTGSTWLWSRFRALDRAVAYCEIFHEMLATLRVEEISRYHPRAWASHHPDTPPYFLEFMSHISAGGGISTYTPDMAFGRFIPQGGPYASVTPEEEVYVANLISAPSRLNKVCVLTDTRTLGRAAGLKRCFGGFHIFAYRNLFQQWNSYSSQLLSGNRYFLDTIKASIEHAQHVDYFRRLKEFLSLRREQQAPDWLDRNTFDDVFVAFVALHIYLYMAALRTVDLVIDVNQLASNPVCATETEYAVAQASGLKIDLSGAAEAIEVPASQLHDPPATRSKIEALLSCAAAEVDADEKTIKFARRLLDEMWAEHARYTFYAGAAHRLLSLRDDAIRRLEAERDALIKEIRSLRDDRDEARQIAHEALQEAQQARQEADASRAHMEAAMLQARLAREEADRARTETNQARLAINQAEAQLVDLLQRYEDLRTSLDEVQANLVRARADVEQRDQALAAMHASLSWRITQPLRLVRYYGRKVFPVSGHNDTKIKGTE